MYKVKSPYRIKFVKRKIAGSYVGMNYKAAKALRIKWPHGRKTILIWEGLNEKDRQQTIKHELVEVELMEKGLPYGLAHYQAELKEKLPR